MGWRSPLNDADALSAARYGITRGKERGDEHDRSLPSLTCAEPVILLD
jgi:hypothetical protein